MKKRIYYGMFPIVTTFTTILSVIFSYVGYSLYKDECMQALKSIADVIVSYESNPQSIHERLKSTLDYDVRITFIDYDGTVTYDSKADGDSYGKVTRYPNTLKDNTYYYTISLKDGMVRFSRDIKSMGIVFLLNLPITILILIVVAYFLGKSLKKIPYDIDTSYMEEKTYKKILYEYPKLKSKIKKFIECINAQEDRINLITDNMVEGMVILDEDNDILSINKSAINILNPNFNIAQGRAFSELTKDSILTDAVNSVKQLGHIKTIIDIDNNHYRTFINRIENINGTIIILVDVTEAIKAEEIRRDFSANVSHELKTPLTTIKGFGELFENGILTDIDDIKKYGAMIERESERLLFLINDIIRLSEIEEKSEKTLSPINLYERAEYSINLLMSKANTKNVTISLVGSDIVINGHEGYINELFINLIDNSIKYNHEGGSIVVDISHNEDNAIVSIEDTGIGISSQDCERIFERFYRVDKSHSRKIGGTGLGLSIVKHIVAYHNGEISIESELGVGTKIFVRLPIKG